MNALGQITRADSSINTSDRAYEFDLIGYRLIQAQVPGGNTVKFIYDSQSRRIAETVGTATKITVYDGWNPIAEYGSAGLQPASLAKSFTWGIDLSGTLQGAGGVGGLLMTSLITNNSITSNFFPTFDGNGNVSEYLDSTGNVSAHYEYDPFGKTTVATGPKANDFAHRFSTKPLDATTGLYYYGYRFYDPNTGRWPSRDPISEAGGINLYGFAFKNPFENIDYLGMNPRPLGDSDLNKPLVGGAYMIEIIVGDVKIFRHKITCICSLYCFKEYEFEIYMDVSIITGGKSRVAIENPDKTVTRLGSNTIFRFKPKTAPKCADYGTNCKTESLTRLDYLLSPPTDNHISELNENNGVPSDVDRSEIPGGYMPDKPINNTQSSDQLP